MGMPLPVPLAPMPPQDSKEGIDEPVSTLRRRGRRRAPAPLLSIVVPVRDEGGNLARLCEELRQAFAGESHEILFVDDGSTDGTLQELQRLRIGLPELRIFSHARGAGQSAALRTGVSAARGEWIGTLDGDGQNDPADLLRLWNLAIEDAVRAETADAFQPAAAPGLYIGHRVTRRDGVWRRLASRVANQVRSRLLGDGTPDTGCGVKLFRRQLFLSLPYFDHMHRFLPALVRREGLSVRSVAVNHRPRAAGRSKYGVLDRLGVGLVDLAGLLWLQRRRQPTGAVSELASAVRAEGRTR